MSTTPNKTIIGISIGDLNGIGSEIILSTFSDSRMFDFCTPVVFASHKALQYLKKHFNSNTLLHQANDISKLHDKKLNIINVWDENFDFNFGEENNKAGELAIKSLRAATKALKTMRLAHYLLHQLINQIFSLKNSHFLGIQII